MTEMKNAPGANGQKLILRNYACVWLLGQYGYVRTCLGENGIIISYHQFWILL